MLRAAAVLLLLSAAAVDAEVSDKLLASLIGQQLRLSLRQADLRQSIWIETALDNATHDDSMKRERTHSEDLPHHHPQLQRHFA